MNNKLSRISIGNYHKNCKTGEVIEYTKEKPLSPLRCHALIQLFNAETGELESEQLSENLINDSLNRVVYKMIIENILSTGSTFGSCISGSYSLFSSIVLTDAAGAENATLKYIEGTMIGWATKCSAVVTDAYRGTINTISSSIENPLVASFVFDWPTTSANGTFRTIWWMPYILNPVAGATFYTGYLITGTAVSNTLYSQFQPTMQSCMYKNSLYGIYYTSTKYQVYKAKKSMESIGTLGAPIFVKDISTEDSAMRGVQWDGTNFWCYGSTTQKFYKYDSAFAYTGVSFSVASATYFTNFSFVCLGGYIYTYKYVNSTTWNLHKFNPATGFVVTYELHSYGGHGWFTSTNAASATLASDGVNIFLTYSTGMLIVDGSGTYVFDMYVSLAFTTSIPIFDEYKILWNFPGSGSILTPYIIPSPTAQNLLGVATTKTSANTMKITLTLTLDVSSL